jgi:hypothetical protein
VYPIVTEVVLVKSKYTPFLNLIPEPGTKTSQPSVPKLD